MEPLSLRNQSIIYVAHRTYGNDGEDIFDNTLLPDEVIQVIRNVKRALSEWKNEMDYVGRSALIKEDLQLRLLHQHRPLDLMQILRLDIIGRDKGIFVWRQSSAMNNSTIQLDRAATARRILVNYYEPTWYSAIVNDVAFVLASMYCLEDHVQRIWPHSSRQALAIDYNVAIAYWSRKMLNRNVDAQQALRKLVTRDAIFHDSTDPHNDDNCDYCYAIFRAFWPIIVREFGQFPAVDMVEWLRDALIRSFGGGLRRQGAFLWEQIPADSRALLVRTPTPRYGLLCSLFEYNQDEKFIEIWASIDENARREAFMVVRPAFPEMYSTCGKLKIVDYILRTTVIGHLHEPWAAERRSISYVASMAMKIWKSLDNNPDERIRRFREEYAELVPLIARKVSSRVEIDTLWNESSDDQRTQILVGYESAAFQMACALNRLEVVKFLWEAATLEQRLQLITHGGFGAFAAALKRGNLVILQFLWENMDATTALGMFESQAFDDNLSRLICTAEEFFVMTLPAEQRLNQTGFPRQRLENLLTILATDPRSDGNTPIAPRMKAILLEALMADNGKGLKRLYRRAKDGGNPALLVSLLSEFDQEQKSRLRTVMSARQARLCGYSEILPNVPWVEEEDSLDYS